MKYYFTFFTIFIFDLYTSYITTRNDVILQLDTTSLIDNSHFVWS